MSRSVRVLLICVLLSAGLPVLPAAAQTQSAPILPPNCSLTPQPSGELYLICLPWATPPASFDLIIFAHGYVAPNEPLDKFLEQLILPDGSSIPAIANGLGYAFASTSYRKNGLAVKEGVVDVAHLVNAFSATVGVPQHIYLIGASEGGLVTTLAVEQQPDLYAGGLAMCGPIGNFRQQVNYWGDFRVVFDYFFGDALQNLGLPMGSPVNVPQDVMDRWYTNYVPAITNLITAAPHSTAQLLNVTHASIDPADPSTTAQTVLGILGYNVFATNEAETVLGGQPFDNNPRWYFGSDNDWRLNRQVQRFDADPSALTEIAANYQTSGHLDVPLVTLHTTGDEIVPYWHEPLYTAKTIAAHSFSKHINIPILRYGHCNFKAGEAVLGFYLLVWKATGKPLASVDKALADPAARSDFYNLLRNYARQMPELQKLVPEVEQMR